MNAELAFWILFGVALFALALAVQMRLMVAKVLRVSVAAHHRDLPADEVALSVRASPPGPVSGEASPQVMEVRDWVRAQHPGAVAHLARARRWSRVMPVVVIVILAIGRIGLGVI